MFLANSSEKSAWRNCTYGFLRSCGTASSCFRDFLVHHSILHATILFCTHRAGSCEKTLQCPLVAMTECDLRCLLVAFDDLSLPKDCACMSSRNDDNVVVRKPFFLDDDALDDGGGDEFASPPLLVLYVCSNTTNLETMNTDNIL
jgi:hypothetical protein